MISFCLLVWWRDNKKYPQKERLYRRMVVLKIIEYAELVVSAEISSEDHCYDFSRSDGRLSSFVTLPTRLLLLNFLSLVSMLIFILSNCRPFLIFTKRSLLELCNEECSQPSSNQSISFTTSLSTTHATPSTSTRTGQSGSHISGQRQSSFRCVCHATTATHTTTTNTQ